MFAEIIISLLIFGTGAIAAIWYFLFKKRAAAESEAPNKLEPKEQPSGYPPLNVAVPSTPVDWSERVQRRKYTKRSKYWGSTKLKAKLKKARKAKRSTK